METITIYKCSKCGKMFNSESECVKHEQEQENIIDNKKLTRIVKNTIKEKALRGSIETTEDYIYKILLPNLKALAEATGSDHITFNTNSIDNYVDMRISKKFVFDKNIFYSIMQKSGLIFVETKRQGYNTGTDYTVATYN